MAEHEPSILTACAAVMRRQGYTESEVKFWTKNMRRQVGRPQELAFIGVVRAAMLSARRSVGLRSRVSAE